MVRLSMLALAVMSFCFVSPALKAEEAAKVEVVEGVVKSVDGEKAAFVIVVAEKEVAVTTDKDTKFLDAEGKEAKLADVVKEKATVKVSHTGGKAAKVEVCKAKCGSCK